MREKDSFNIAAAVCSAVSVLLLVFPVAGFVHAARAVLTYSLYPAIYCGSKTDSFIRGVPDNFRRLFDADQENRKLLEKLKILETELENMRSYAAEAERLRAEMGIAKKHSWKGTWASVSGRDVKNWYGFLTIDKGIADGIRVNDTVVSMNGGRVSLAGRIYEAYPHFSRVMLAGNTAFSAIVSLGRNGKEVLAEGTGTSKLKIEYIPFDLSLEDGTEVFTARSGTLYVPGINLGVLSKIYKRDSEVSFSSAEINLSADMEALKELYVISRNLPEDLVPPSEEGSL